LKRIREKDAVFTRRNSSNYLSIRRSKEDEGRTEALLVEMKEIAKRQTSETKRIEEDFTVHISLLAL
jgi:hypothetical protein